MTYLPLQEQSNIQHSIPQNALYQVQIGQPALIVINGQTCVVEPLHRHQNRLNAYRAGFIVLGSIAFLGAIFGIVGMSKPAQVIEVEKPIVVPSPQPIVIPSPVPIEREPNKNCVAFCS